MQKVTPQRQPAPSNNASTQVSAAYRSGVSGNSNAHQPLPNPTKVLNKNAAAASLTTRKAFTTVAAQQQQQLARQQMQQKQLSVAPQQQQQLQQFRRSEPVPTAKASVDAYMNNLNQLSSVSITPAKPKEKAVIDLTDEDDMAGAAVKQLSSQPPPLVARLPTLQNMNSHQNNGGIGVAMLPSALMGNRIAPSLTRLTQTSSNTVSSTTKQQVAGRQLSTFHAQKSNASGTLPVIQPPTGTSITCVVSSSVSPRPRYNHPAPLPSTPPQAYNGAWKYPPPRPTIRISNLDNGIVISWTMEESEEVHAQCVSYQIYAYQQTSGPPLTENWRHVGDVKAMLLPMAVTLTQFQEGQRYFFAVRGVDVHQRLGPFSLPKTWA